MDHKGNADVACQICPICCYKAEETDGIGRRRGAGLHSYQEKSF